MKFSRLSPRFAWRTEAIPGAKPVVADRETSASGAVPNDASAAAPAPQAFAIPEALGLKQIEPLIEADGFPAFEED